ncbi:hypothetical protein AB0G15_05815 [Streptosporangium sp. NPDC023825]|uniref:hypothetical protein n=1 Tax=Streptosporangium sp. NPDC023825 TaxID=3154909 RepID=UPI0034464264
MTDDLIQIFDNDESLYDAVNERTIEVLSENGYDKDNPEESRYDAVSYHRLVGDAVQDLVNDLTDNLKDENTLAGQIFRNALLYVEWRKVGEHYYDDNTERLAES